MKVVDIIVQNYDADKFKASDAIDIITSKYSNLNTIQTCLSLLRNELLKITPIENYENAKDYLLKNKIKTSPLIPLELNKLFLSKEDSKKRYLQGINNLNKKHDIMITIKEEFIDTILDGLKSNEYSTLLPALLLVSGRRTKEIISSAKFSSRNGSCLFSGQLKTNDKKAYNIPLLAPIKDVQFALRRLRKIIKNKNLNMDQIYSKNQKLFIKLSKKCGCNITPHYLRGLYATICYDKYGDNMTKNRYFQKILGHSLLETSLHYVKYKIIC